MNIYEQFIKKQNEIINIINQKEQLEFELTEIKKEIYKKHLDRFKKKPIGKTTINDDGFEIIYNRTEKVTVLTELVSQDNFSSDCIVKKIVPEKETISFSKTEFKKLSDSEQEKVEKYIVREMGKPTMSVKIKDEK